MRAAGIVVVAVVVAVLSSAAPSARADKIVFQRLEKGTERMWVMRPDGSAKRRLPRFGVSSWWDVSRDGRRLAWAIPDANQIRIGPLTGGTLRYRVAWRTRGHPPLWLRWSPSGRQIAAWRQVESPDDSGRTDGQIFIVRPGGKARQLPIPGASVGQTSSWSPDGRRIVVAGSRQQPTTCTGPPWMPVCQTNFTYSFWIIDVESGAVREIPQDAPVAGPAWSPDGRTIAFSRRGEGQSENYQLWLIRPDGTGLRQLTDMRRGAEDPSWSPNGRRLAFTTDIPAGRNIATIRADGSSFRALTHGAIKRFDPVWTR